MSQMGFEVVPAVLAPRWCGHEELERHWDRVTFGPEARLGQKPVASAENRTDVLDWAERRSLIKN